MNKLKFTKFEKAGESLEIEKRYFERSIIYTCGWLRALWSRD